MLGDFSVFWLWIYRERIVPETCLAHLFIDLHFYYSIESHNGRYRILILINIYLGKECLSGMFCDFDTDPCICVLHTTWWHTFVSVSLLQKNKMTAYGMTEILLKETFEDSREIIRSRKSNTERQYYGQKKQGVIVW